MPEGVGSLSRPRSSNPTRAVSIAIPDRLNDRLRDHLSHGQSRSAFICSAIREKLDGDGGLSVGDASAIQLLTALFNRGLFNKSMYDTLKFQIEAKKIE